MRNSTIFGTRDLVDRFMTALHSVAPRGVENYVSLPLWEQRVGNRRVDARVEWVLDGRPYNLDLEIRLGTPNATDLPKPYEQLPRDARSIPVFVSPYLSPGTRARLEDLGWSYWDATGNMLLFCREPFITIRSTGASRDPSPSAEPRPLATLKGRSTSAVMVHLLTYGGAASVRDLARETKIGLGTVSRVVALLREENFLQPKGGGSIALANRVDVARRWAEDYRFETTYRAKRYYSRLGDKAAVDRIKISGIDYAFTGLRAAAASFALREQVAPLPASDVWVYTDDVAALVREADLAPDPRRGTIWLAESDVIGTGQEGLVGNSAEKYVLPWRAVGDLLSTPGRHAAVGEELARLLAQERAPYGSQ